MLSNESGGAAGKRNASPPAPYYLAVDRQLKSGYDSYEKAEQAALAIKRQHPRLLVTVYEAKLRRHIAIEEQKAGVASGKRDSSGERGAVAHHPASATKH